MSVPSLNRRHAIQFAAASLATATSLPRHLPAVGQPPGGGPARVVHPRGRVPLSFIIDDSTCLVNMGHFCMPQFAEAWPQRDIYKQDWRSWPREIPDAFVREFGEWCREHGVKGKYSIVPYPACVGWLDRMLPGWSRKQLDDSLALVRDLMLPNWDIHPEMISHTRVIDLKTGRPMAEANAATMENIYPQTDVSVDHLADYLALALRVLKNCGLPCEGITTPGGFGNAVKDKLPIAVHQAVRDVYGSELPHYFKYVRGGDRSTAPTLEYTTPAKRIEDLTINVPAGTGDWFGGWEGSKQSAPERYSNRDATAGRMVELIERNEPAVMLCHWPGMYCNGTKSGFRAFQSVVTALASRFADQTIWMKVSEIGRYWAVKETAKIDAVGPGAIEVQSALACDDFTLEVPADGLNQTPTITHDGKPTELRRVAAKKDLQADTIAVEQGKRFVCVDLKQGVSRIDC